MPIAYSSSDSRLYVGTANDDQAGLEGLYKVSIPTIVNNANIASLNTASIIAGPVNVFNGTLNSIDGRNGADNGGIFGGLLLNGNKLSSHQPTRIMIPNMPPQRPMPPSMRICRVFFSGLYP